MAAAYNECKAVQLNFSLVRSPPTSHPIESLDDADKQRVQRGENFFTTAAAYAMEQGTRPATLGLVLQSNPLALLAWIGEKFLTWSDEDPDIDTILRSVTLWWLTETMPSSCYPYRGGFEGTGIRHDDPGLHIKKPFGYSLFPKELIPSPKSWVATTGDLSWHRQHESGGHFAALEKPAEMKQDLEDFLKHVVEEKGVKFGP